MAIAELTTHLPLARVRQIPRFETEVPGMRRVFTLPIEPVTVWNTPLPHAHITDMLYTADIPRNRMMSPDMVMVSPTMRVGQLFPLRLDRDRLAEIYNDLKREHAFFFTKKGIFLVGGDDRSAKDLRFDQAIFSVFEDEEGVIRHQEKGKEPQYFYDPKKKTAQLVREIKTVRYKNQERHAFFSLRFDTEFFRDAELNRLILSGNYDPQTLRKFISYSFLLS
jgi:hypothetical protein